MSKRILVVEDHADNRQIIRDMLALRQVIALARREGAATKQLSSQ